MLVDFILHLKEEKGIQGNEVSRIMAALRSRWVDKLSDVRVFDDPSVRRARKASRGGSQRDGHKEKERKRRMPVTMDLIEREGG